MSEEKQKVAQPGLLAVGAYLRFLREAAGITIAEIANKVDLDPSQIWRIERGKSDPRASVLFKITATVRGAPDDVARLINNASATPSDGETLAKLRRGLQS